MLQTDKKKAYKEVWTLNKMLSVTLKRVNIDLVNVM